MRTAIAGRTFEPGDQAELFRKANEEYYARVDWALDVSQGEFEELELTGIPADLIRRDPGTQAVVRHATVVSTQETWEKLNLEGTPWLLALRDLLRWNLRDEVLVAPKRSKHFQRWLTGLERLILEANRNPATSARWLVEATKPRAIA